MNISSQLIFDKRSNEIKQRYFFKIFLINGAGTNVHPHKKKEKKKRLNLYTGLNPFTKTELNASLT